MLTMQFAAAKKGVGLLSTFQRRKMSQANQISNYSSCDDNKEEILGNAMVSAANSLPSGNQNNFSLQRKKSLRANNSSSGKRP